MGQSNLVMTIAETDEIVMTGDTTLTLAAETSDVVVTATVTTGIIMIGRVTAMMETGGIGVNATGAETVLRFVLMLHY